MQRLFWHLYLFIFLVLLGSGWAVEQLWQQWQPNTQAPWLQSYRQMLQQQMQQPLHDWQQRVNLPVAAIAADSISWSQHELAQLQQGNILSLFDAEQVYFYALQDQQLWRLGPVALEQKDGATWFTLLFFILLAIAVALWLWPVARDIRTLQNNLQQLTRDDTKQLPVPARSFIAPIAQRFVDMSAQIRELVNLQRDMTHAVSHELRTPIARLSFALEMARQLPEQERQLMLQDVRELQQLVDEILDYARLEAGQLPLQYQHIDLTELISNVQEKLTPLPGATISLQLPEKALCYGDGHYLERALQNLLVNAKKYAQLQIKVSLIEQPYDWQIMVEDDGPGIADSLKTDIFKPFYRIETSRNKHSGGFGLGLAIVQRVAQWHRGSVQAVDSTLGGAAFVLVLPKRP
ncbi:MAG TPA: ATP-binding protein [Rheinheimera sp.]|nr:ATP-binding protein [Rheinheimera sp.]